MKTKRTTKNRMEGGAHEKAAYAFKRMRAVQLARQGDLTSAVIAERLGLSDSWVADVIRREGITVPREDDLWPPATCRRGRK